MLLAFFFSQRDPIRARMRVLYMCDGVTTVVVVGVSCPRRVIPNGESVGLFWFPLMAAVDKHLAINISNLARRLRSTFEVCGCVPR